MRRGRALATVVLVLAAVRCGGGSSGGSGTTGTPTGPSGSASCSVTPLGTDTRITGSFTGSDANDCAGPNRGNQYSLTLTGQTDLEFVMTPSGFPAFLGVYTAANRVVLQDSGTGERRGKAFLPAGEYRVVAGRADNAGGSYSLSVGATSNSPCPLAGGGTGPFMFMPGTVPGATINGSLDANDCGTTSSNRSDPYLLSVGAGEALRVTLTGSQNVLLEAYRDAAGHPLVMSGSVTRGASRTFTYTTPAAGLVQLFVASAGSPLPMTYTLAIATN